MKAVLDTNILVDYLHGIERAKSEVDRYDKPTISLITWIEILVGAQDKQEESLLKRATVTSIAKLDRVHPYARPLSVRHSTTVVYG